MSGSGPSARRLQILLNGEPHETAAPTLAGLIEELGHAGRRVATAVNGDFVPERARATLVLAAGDAVEIVSPRQGG